MIMMHIKNYDDNGIDDDDDDGDDGDDDNGYDCLLHQKYRTIEKDEGHDDIEPSLRQERQLQGHFPGKLH